MNSFCEKLRAAYKPYTGIIPLPWKMETWNSDKPIFDDLIEKIRPSLIIEVGSWMGGSAIRMANKCRSLGLDTDIICIDTWFSGSEKFPDDVPHCIGGWPQAYYQFASNVIRSECQDKITPFPQTSLHAARCLARHNVTAPLIYIDASHHADDVFSDLASYTPLCTDIIFGDDMDWLSVETGVKNFIAANCLLSVFQNRPHWYIKK